MKSIILRLLFCLLGYSSVAQDLSYYLPAGVTYDPAVPKPADVIYHEVGEWHVTHDRLVMYMQALSKAVPQRIQLVDMGRTYENRPQVMLIITSPRNHARLEQIRTQHVQLTDPTRSASLNMREMPAVLWIGHSIHGNEPSGANASLLTAYHLAAAQGAAIETMLDSLVILLDPSFNPDGLQRFSTWTNQHKSKNLVSDPNTREYNEVWPGGRFNHYWFDLNRDWLPAQLVESQNRLRWFHQWKPNILTDHHEQGSDASFFFQPGVPSRVNPLTPPVNQELTNKLATFHAAALDRIGSLYFTKENYDDFYYGKGSTYPDINGSIGILFEQASSRGSGQQTSNGLLTFPFTIRNQFVTALSTLQGGLQLRTELLEYQRRFYQEAANRAAVYPVKSYVFGDPEDPARVQIFLEMLQRHQIEVRSLSDNKACPEFPTQTSYVVSLNQPQHSLIRTLFERNRSYRDSLFYDITAWTMPLAFGIPCKELNVIPATREMKGLNAPVGIEGGRSEYAYLIRWTDLHAPAALNEMHRAGWLVKAATGSFTAEGRTYQAGTLLVPVGLQSVGADKLFEQLNVWVKQFGISVFAVRSGLSEAGSDLGSSRLVTLNRPSVALLVGTGVNATDAGEVWHLMDQRMGMRLTLLEIAQFNRVDVSKYNTLILVGGSYADLNKDKMRSWVQAGGTLILTEEGNQWAQQAGLAELKFKRSRSGVDSTQWLSYASREQLEGAQQMRGAILEAKMDPTHPLSFGYTTPTVSLFKANRVFLEKSRNPFGTPYLYTANPLQSGWMSRENLEAVQGGAAVLVTALGQGRMIHMADNPNLRAYWLGGSKLLLNAIFFGKLIELGSARTEE
ncbi:MAG: zinc carboxypeptidase [Bacteroidetes bacterium]|nr:zinc carboxypeptidase [Bacteroidota bacterium]